MAPRKNARILAANQASSAAPPLARRAAFLRAVEAISVTRRRWTTTTASRRRTIQSAANQRRAIQIAANQPPAEDPPVTNLRGTNRRGTNRRGTNRRGTNRRGTQRGTGGSAVTEALPASLPVAVPEKRMVSQIGIRRLRKEMEKMTSDPTEGCTVELVDDCIYDWKAVILGPSDTPYEGGHFELRLQFPQAYPAQPPFLMFLTKVYHCNVHNRAICVDILRSTWSPALTVEKILLSIRSLLSDPNPDSPLNCDAAELYKTDRKEHDRMARLWTRRYAQPSDD